ncbi:haloacid dehalogenase superfamily subfamily IA variant 3 [Clostridium sp. CAG:762]|nr:haloacid dehalogenase superfamily subfamily IA variant 3 [Clostridium sp. CAG:762]
MLKVIAFDFVGVLVNEKDIDLGEQEDKLERKFGSNLNDEDYLTFAEQTLKINNKEAIDVTKNIINKLYKVRDADIFTKLKNKYNNIKIIIATNHLSYVEEFINKYFDTTYLDDVIISANINKIKPNANFYNFILEKFNIKSKEFLFLDDNVENIDGANKLNIRTIKVEKNMNLYEEVCKFISNVRNCKN